MSKITRLQAENIKRLKVIDIRPGGGVVDIRGRNAQGKSSTLDAIQMAFGGAKFTPSRPIRAGEDEAAIRIELDTGEVILRRFSADGRDSMEFISSEGFKGGSQAMLNGLYASVAFDPLAFTRLKPADQLAKLRGLVTLDVDVDALEKANAADYDKRRDLGRELKTAESSLAQMPEYTNLPAEPIDEAAIEQVIASASEANGLIERRRMNRESIAEKVKANHQSAAGWMEKRAQLLREANEAERMANEATDIAETFQKQLNDAEPLPEPVDIAQAQADLRAARDMNAKIKSDQVRVAQAGHVAALEKRVADLTTAMAERTTNIAAAIGLAHMPVPGLGFGDGEVLFNALPLEQASSAEQLRVSTAIGMATSPKLRVMLVRDGSLLDDDGERILAELAEANDFQLWVEAVDTSGKVGIVLEDGAVASIDGEAPPAPEEIEKPKRRAKKQAEPEARTVIARVEDGEVTDFKVLDDTADETIAAAAEQLGGTAEQVEDMRKVAEDDKTGTLTTNDAGLGNDWFGDQDRAREAALAKAAVPSLFD